MRHSVFHSLALGAVALVLLAAPATAGGWAVSTLDALPAEGFHAGETYRVAYTIRQHGDKPFSGAQSAIKVRSGKGGAVVDVFPAIPLPEPGRYVAEVRFRAAGDWTWEVDQSPFPPQSLGTISVGAPPAGPPDSAPRPEFRSLLPVATVLALLLFGWRLLVFARGSASANGVSRPRAAGAVEHSR